MTTVTFILAVLHVLFMVLVCASILVAAIVAFWATIAAIVWSVYRAVKAVVYHG